MRDTVFKRIILAILILAAFWRIGFLASGRVLPVMWDASRYASAGVALLSYVDNSGPQPETNKVLDRDAFSYYNDKYIQGEQIDWLFYTPHTLTQAREDLFLSGPLYPALLAAVFYLAPAADFTCARLVGIALDIIACLLLMLIAMRLVGRKAALLAGAVYAIYFPFTLTSTMLLMETSTGFFILLAVYTMIRGVETDRRVFFVAAGIISGLLVLHKPTAMFLGLPLLAGLYLYTRRLWNGEKFLRRLASVALPAFVFFAVWLGVSSAKYGQLALRDPAYAGVNLRQSSSIRFEGYDLDQVESTFSERKVYGDFFGQLPGYLGLFAKKFERLWSRPYIDFKRSFVLPYEVDERWHVIVVSLGLIGLLFMVSKNLSLAAWPLLIAAYYTSLHLVFHSINRYAIAAIPLLIICGAGLVMALVDRYAASGSAVRRILPAAAVLLLVGWLIEPHWLSAIFGCELSFTMVVTVIILKALLWLTAVTILVRELWGDRWRAHHLWVGLAASLIFTLTAATPLLFRNGWAEFPCRLDDPEMKAGTRLYVSRIGPFDEGDLLALMIDLNAPSGRRNSFSLFIGDREQRYVAGREPLARYFYPKPTYDEYARLEGQGIEHFRQYAVVPVEVGRIRRLLERDGFLDVSVAINDGMYEPNNYITLHGSYSTGNGAVLMPSHHYTSAERYVHRDDPRIRFPVNLVSDSAISYYIARNDSTVIDGQDLSPEAGRQTGRYNMYLAHFRREGGFLVY